MLQIRHFCAVMLLAGSAQAQESYSFDRAQTFLKTYCEKCHAGATAVGGFRLERVADRASLEGQAAKWQASVRRVRNGEMPPRGSPAPVFEERELFSTWADEELRKQACAAGVVPGPNPARRLNRDEYAATIRDLLDIHLDLGGMFPADGAGGEGFDNAAETLFLSPLHSEKYLEVAKFVMDFAAKEHKSRAKVLVAKPGPGLTETQAAGKILESFLPRAFRRPVSAAEMAPYAALYAAARKQGQAFEPAVFFTLRAALVSPLFLFRAEAPSPSDTPRRVDSYALASRLSYFLWGSMPDELLMDVAATGKLHEPAVMREMVRRMLRNDRALGFAQRFVEQWLRTRELATDKAPDATLYPAYANDEELRGDIRFQPILFFREMLVRDLPLDHFLDSPHTIATSNLSKHYATEFPINRAASKQPQWVEVPAGSQRGGLLGMGAVLAVSSYPYRTSPVLRGAWILDSILGTPPPPPPPNVPALEEERAGTGKTMRERLTQHRANAVCASCHSKIDALGFALENYDVLGRFRREESGQPIDASGELADGTKLEGIGGLKAALLERKDVFVRNLASRMLGYALGRGLGLRDSCTVDDIVRQVKAQNYRTQALIEAIVMSVPFQYQQGQAKEKR